MIRTKLAEYTLHITEYGYNERMGLWYCLFYYEDNDGITQYGTHHDKSMGDIVEWAHGTIQDFIDKVARRDIPKHPIELNPTFEYGAR